VTQSKSNNSGAADYRLDGAWGSLPGNISSPRFFCPITNEGTNDTKAIYLFVFVPSWLISVLQQS
ncbi:MAG TPA: hypothetical protein VKA78_15805, partial [Pyrinomonadaceae bacterium]|nr:hypothetical protein [Pyrinomonadaceae bacterium]